MSKFNKNNPTDLWSEDEKYDLSKLENKWMKKMAKKPSATNSGTGFWVKRRSNVLFCREN